MKHEPSSVISLGAKSSQSLLCKPQNKFLKHTCKLSPQVNIYQTVELSNKWLNFIELEVCKYRIIVF